MGNRHSLTQVATRIRTIISQADSLPGTDKGVNIAQKLLLAIITLTVVLLIQRFSGLKYNAGLVVVVNSVIGLFSTLAVLSYFYTKI